MITIDFSNPAQVFLIALGYLAITGWAFAGGFLAANEDTGAPQAFTNIQFLLWVLSFIATGLSVMSLVFHSLNLPTP